MESNTIDAYNFHESKYYRAVYKVLFDRNSYTNTKTMRALQVWLDS